jgi:hypothetical protein
MTSADFVKKMQDSMQQQQSRGEMAVIDMGDKLAYSWQNAAPSNGAPVSVGFIGKAITVEKMSEVIISSVISL